jgi:sugar phosphate permease
VALVTDKYGWDALFQLFVIVALIAAFLLILKWNYGKVTSETESEIALNTIPELSTITK